MKEHDIVRYKGETATLLWFNPCEREWMMRTEGGRLCFAGESELESIFPTDAMNPPEAAT